MVTITDFRLEWARECDVFLSTHRASILLFSTGFVPPSGTSQVSGQSVGAVNPPQLSTVRVLSLVAPSQHLQQGRSLCKWNDVECHSVSNSHCAVLLKRLARWECFVIKNKTKLDAWWRVTMLQPDLSEFETRWPTTACLLGTAKLLM